MRNHGQQYGGRESYYRVGGILVTDDPLGSYKPPERPRTTKSRICGIRFWIFVLAIILIALVTVGAILGGVLGSRVMNNAAAAGASASSPTTSAAPPRSSTPPGSSETSKTFNGTLIRKNSKFTTAGYMSNDEHFIWLFYQGADDMIRYSQFNSSGNIWTSPHAIIKAAPESPLAVTIFNRSFDTSEFYQIELFYLDSSNIMREWNNDVTDPKGNAVSSGNNGSLSALAWKLPSDTSITAWWPNLWLQHEDNTLQQIAYRDGFGWLQVDNFRLPDGSDSRINVYEGTGLAVVPKDQVNQGIEVFYQRQDMKAQEFFWYGAEHGSQQNWNIGTTLDTIPPGASIAALATPRGSGNDSNIHLLWQDDSSGDIQVKWMDDPSGWQGPTTYPAFSGADKGTNIACYTPSARFNTQIQDDGSAAYCFFQRDGEVRQVQLKDRQWSFTGTVPIREIKQGV